MSRIAPPLSPDDEAGALRVFSEFFDSYQPVFARVNYYFEQVVIQVSPAYAGAYKPWHDSFHELFEGVYFISQGIALPDMQRFSEAVEIFSFASAASFLHDICTSCNLTLDPQWTARFLENIHIVHYALKLLAQKNGVSLTNGMGAFNPVSAP